MKDWEDHVTSEQDAERNYEMLEYTFQEAGLEVPRDTKILEIGSGNNVFLQYLQSRGLDAIGVDARPRGEKSEGVVRARIEELPFPDETFGLILASSVLDDSVYNQHQVVMAKEISRVLKHDGFYFGAANYDRRTPFGDSLELLFKTDYYPGLSLYKKK